MDRSYRAQSGIGTLIVFIGIILVAAIASGVLINTSGYLEQQASATGEETTDEVSQKLTIVSRAAYTDEKYEGVDFVELYVELAPGSDSINMSKITVSYDDDETAKTIAGDNDDLVKLYSEVGDDPYVMDENEDVYRVLIDANNIRDLEGISPERPQAGESIDIRLQPPSGSTTRTQINLPKNLPEEGNIEV